PATPAPSPAPATPAPSPAPAPAASDRIEPFDPGAQSTASTRTAKSKAAAELPRSRLVLATAVRLGPLDEDSGLKKKAQAASESGIPRKIGVPRSIAATATARGTLAQLRWQSAQGGVQRAALSFTSEDAWGVRPGLLVRSLPANTMLRFYTQAGTEVIQVSGDEVLRTVQRNLAAGDTSDAARTYWVPDFGGAETTVELELPAKANLAELDIAVPTLSHFFVSPGADAAPVTKALGDADSCHTDVSCDAQYSSESRSVARIIYVKDDGTSYLCTGTLLNDASSSRTPYFLSANHCISTQTLASTMTTDWFYRSTACNSGELNPDTRRVTGGATLLYNSADTDTSFMRLNSPAPQGSVYAGSYFGNMNIDMVRRPNISGIHHPKGDLQKLSTGTIMDFSRCVPGEDDGTFNCSISNAQNGNFYSIRWRQGRTEKGSSGSGLLYTIGNTRYVMGQLYGGSSRCLSRFSTGMDTYGRFDVAFRNSLKNWLKPDH
ncbi:trypsin-like serine peptidase, partial [Verminephrobacter aporrectodeae]